MNNLLLIILTFFAAVSFSPQKVSANNPFSPAIVVDGEIITHYQITQRARLLQVLNVPGNPKSIARTQLIEDSLKRSAAAEQSIVITEAELQAGIEEFAARANLNAVRFVKELAKLGIDRTAFEQFIKTSLLWRYVVQAKFGARSRVTDEQLQRAVQSAGDGSNVRVLLSEIILPLLPGQEEQTLETAEAIKNLTGFDAFSKAAKRYSAAPSREMGGRVTWQDLNSLPAVLKPLIFGLAPGEVTEPLRVPNAVALFQLRAIEETGYAFSSSGTIDYLTYEFEQSDLDTMQHLKTKIVHCDDLYAEAERSPTHVLLRKSTPVKNIQTELAEMLSLLDRHEKYFFSKGGKSILVMLCARTDMASQTSQNLDAIRTGLRNKRLESFAAGYLENLRQDARIIKK